MRTAHFSEVHLEADTISITYNSQTGSSFGSDLLRSDLNGLFLFHRKEAVMEKKKRKLLKLRLRGFETLKSIRFM